MVVGNGISPQYFLDEMSIDEIEIFLKAKGNLIRGEWIWDKNEIKLNGKKLTKEEIEKKTQRAERYIQKIKGIN